MFEQQLVDKFVTFVFEQQLLDKFVGSELVDLQVVPNFINFFMAVIMPLAAYFSMILTELHRWWRNYNRKFL